MRPVIGISCYVEPADWGVWRGVAASLLPQAYVAAVQRAGAVAVLLPPLALDDPDAGDAAALLSRLDGLLLAGGVDVEPARYGELPHPAAQPPRRDRDAAELAFARESARTGLPTLGICRGMQVMAVAAGGSLEQHLPDRLGHEGHAPGPGRYGGQQVSVNPGTVLRDVLGESVEVSCYHHQAVREHPGYVSAAVAADGVVEAMVDPAARFRVGVQWHPEQGTDPRLFRALVAAAVVR